MYKSVEEIRVRDKIHTPPGSKPSFSFTVRKIEREEETGKLLFYTDGLEWPVKVLPGMEVEYLGHE